MSDQNSPIDFDTADFASEEELDRAIAKETGTGGALRRDWKLLPKALPYLRPYRKLAALSMLLTVLLALVALAEPWPLAFVVDSVLGDKPAPGWATAIFGDSTGGADCARGRRHPADHAALRWAHRHQRVPDDQGRPARWCSTSAATCSSTPSGSRWRSTTRSGTGILMYRINTQAAAVGQIVVGLPAIAQSRPDVIGMAYITFRIDPLLALLALGVTPFIFYSTTYYADRIEPRLYRVRGLEGMNMAIVHEAMSMMRVVLAFGREPREWKRFRDQGEKAVDGARRADRAPDRFQARGPADHRRRHRRGARRRRLPGDRRARSRAGELPVVLTYIAQVYAPLEQLTQHDDRLPAVVHRLPPRLRPASTWSPRSPRSPTRRAIDRARGALELENVGFGYGDAAGDVLKDVTFEVAAGGGGGGRRPDRSRQVDPGEPAAALLRPAGGPGADRRRGRARPDARRRCARSSASSSRSRCCSRPAIADNIRYGKPGRDRRGGRARRRRPRTPTTSSRSLPKGYGTLLGERGAKISGGERQRIAVARAFLRDAPILILDEPTSSIDSTTETVILDALDRLMEGRTTILIAHRLSTLRSVDEIVVLNDGEVVEQGTHEELIAKTASTRSSGRPRSATSARSETRPAARRPARSTEPASPAAGKRRRPSRAEAPSEAPADRAREGGARRRGGGCRQTARRRARAAAALPRPKIVLLGMLTKIPVGGRRLAGRPIRDRASSGSATRSTTSRRTPGRRRCS